MEVLASSPLFDESRKGLLSDGIAAALSNDYAKAIHILVPQIEHMLRSLAGQIGIPKTTAGGTRGTMQARGLGDILNDKVLKNSMDENIRLYLVAFLVDQRGLNLRNRVAHGLMEIDQLDRSLSNRLLHVFLMLSFISNKGRNAKLQCFRVVSHTYGVDGQLAERAVLSGRHRTRTEAALVANSEAAKNTQWRFDQATDQWRATDAHGTARVLLVEEF
jgi:hypothetical protein